MTDCSVQDGMCGECECPENECECCMYCGRVECCCEPTCIYCGLDEDECTCEEFTE